MRTKEMLTAEDLQYVYNTQKLAKEQKCEFRIENNSIGLYETHKGFIEHIKDFETLQGVYGWLIEFKRMIENDRKRENKEKKAKKGKK